MKKRGVKLKFASDLPYPPITTHRNMKDAKLLMGVYSGACSELTAILTYAYQGYITQKHRESHDTLMGIAKVEMHHHALLGKSIYALGGYPVMGARNYWNGSYCDYTPNITSFLKNDIASEQNAILDYERTVLNVETEEVKALIERIILDEQVHINILKDLINELEQDIQSTN